MHEIQWLLLINTSEVIFYAMSVSKYQVCLYVHKKCISLSWSCRKHQSLTLMDMHSILNFHQYKWLIATGLGSTYMYARSKESSWNTDHDLWLITVALIRFLIWQPSINILKLKSEPYQSILTTNSWHSSNKIFTARAIISICDNSQVEHFAVAMIRSMFLVKLFQLELW